MEMLFDPFLDGLKRLCGRILFWCMLDLDNFEMDGFGGFVGLAAS